MALAWPLTGRTTELIRVREALHRRAPGVLFVGAPGVGKTRVAREAEAAARAARRPTAWIAATRAAAGIPLGPLATVLPAAAAPSTSRLVGQAVAALEALSGSRRALVCIDDAHLLDETSATVVHQVALRGAVTLVVTMRAEPGPDAITALWKDGPLERFELAGLDRRSMGDLLHSALGAPVETVARERLLTLAGGNALLLRHLVEGEVAAGRLAEDRGCWYWRDGGVPARIGDLLSEQLASVSEPERRVLELLAVAEPVPLDALDSLVGRDAVTRAETAGLVTLGAEAGVEAVRLAHPLYAEVLRDQLRPLRSRELRTALSDALVGTASGLSTEPARYWLLRRCVLALDSDATVPAADLHAAAGAAMALLDEPLAERLCRAALQLSPSFQSRLRLGYSLIRQERTTEGAALLRELADSSSEVDLAVAVRPIAASLFWDDDDPLQAQAILQQTRSTLTSGPAVAEIDALQASFASFLAEPEQSVALAESVLERDDVSAEATAWACAASCMTLAAVGRPREVDELTARGWEAALASDTERFLVLPLTNGAVLTYGRAGELDRAAAATQRLEAISGELPSAQARSALLMFRGQLAAWHGDLPAAARLLEDAAFGFGDPPGAPTCWAVQCLLAAVTVHAAAGNAVAARHALDRLDGHDRSAMSIFDSDVALARACVAAVEGALDEAIDLARSAAAIARGQGLPAAEAEAWHRAVRWGDTGAAARLVDLAGPAGARLGGTRIAATNNGRGHQPAGPVVRGPRVALAARQAVALAERDAAALAAVGEDWAEMGAQVLAADAFAQAAGLRSTGTVRAVGPDAARARRLAAAHQARTPALTRILHDGLGAAHLTRREREVTALAVAGLSNAEIAARLTVSPRTVEGHLLQAYGKLGVHRRSDLGSAWAPRP